MFNNYCKQKDYTVASASEIGLNRDNVCLTGHRGFRAVAPENALPAYEEAGKAGFWGAECDIYRTKDGVWVLHHDPITYRMMDKTKLIEHSTYDELLKCTYDQGHNVDKYPNLKITKFEDYLKVCEKYGMRAIIELKYNHTIEYYPEVIELVRKYKVEPTFIAFDFEDCVKIRELSDYPVFYLVYDIKDSQIEQAKTLENCGISFDCNDKKNRANDCERIEACNKAGITTAVWSAYDLETVKLMHDHGVRYITTDCITY